MESVLAQETTLEVGEPTVVYVTVSNRMDFDIYPEDYELYREYNGERTALTVNLPIPAHSAKTATV